EAPAGAAARRRQPRRGRLSICGDCTEAAEAARAGETARASDATADTGPICPFWVGRGNMEKPYRVDRMNPAAFGPGELSILGKTVVECWEASTMNDLKRGANVEIEPIQGSPWLSGGFRNSFRPIAFNNSAPPKFLTPDLPTP